MPTGQEIGARVKSLLSGVTQTELAARVGMPKDAMSRSISGERGFSSVELASIAEVLGADLHWLITGTEDPLRVRIAARHAFNHLTGERSVPGREQDDETLRAVALLYAQAYPAGDHPSKPLPADAASMRAALGEDFVPTFPDRVEAALDVDVVRVQNLSTAYSFTIGGRMVVLLPTTGNWFWSNFALAHELAHLALGHHDATGAEAANEASANAFAAELLLPAAMMRDLDWSTMTAAQCARFVWETGVSLDFLARRVNALGIHFADGVRDLMSRKMPGALRRHMDDLGEPTTARRGPFHVPVDPIDVRMEAAAKRRFPQTLITAHREAVESGRVTGASLAWMLESPVTDLVEAPETDERGSLDDLMAEFGA